MDRILALCAILEAITGFALVTFPQRVVPLLLSGDVAGAEMVVSRIAGIALIALGIACWPEADASGARTNAYSGMLAYSALATCCLTWVGSTPRLRGPLSWPAAVLHLLLTAALVLAWSKRQASDRRSGVATSHR